MYFKSKLKKCICIYKILFCIKKLTFSYRIHHLNILRKSLVQERDYDGLEMNKLILLIQYFINKSKNYIFMFKELITET